MAKTLFDKVVCEHGVPQTMVTDQGTGFVNKVMKEMAGLLSMNRLTISVFQLRANGVIERANYNNVSILRTLVEANMETWPEMLPAATFAYNSAYHRTVRESPFYLLYLRDPYLPYQAIERRPRPWYDVNSYKSEMISISRKVYDLCQRYIEEGREKMEK